MEHISDIKSEIQVLNSKVTDFIHFARPLVIDPYPLDIAEVLETALASTDKEIIDNNISVIKEFPENIPYAMGDFEQLRGLFINLIRNSIQAMDEGGDLCIEMESDNSDNFVRINIRDEGCGMSPEDIEMAFEPFFTKKINGTGLGLSIVKKIVDAHQGHIEIESKVGLGTIVSVFLPVEMTVHNT